MNNGSEKEWIAAIEHLNALLVKYACMGLGGCYDLYEILVPLKKRYEAGERSTELYEEIMAHY